MSLSILLTEQQLQQRVTELGAEIRGDFPDEPLVLLGVLKGCVPFIADLARALGGEVLIDYLQVSSYGSDRSSSGVVKLKKDHDINIEGRHVLLVEDIIDTGLTLDHLKELLATRRPASLSVVAMLNKAEVRKHEADPQYVGFEIPNHFVVGYGLDHAERYRNLPYVAILNPDAV